jgi:hypothetical protein
MTPNNSPDNRTVEQIAREVDYEIRDTIVRIYGTPQRQASDALALVAIALFCATVALIAQLAMR